MTLAAISESLTTIIVVLVLAMVQWIVERIAKKNKQSAQDDAAEGLEDETSPDMARPNDSEEERMRRFMEALGIPADTAAPQRRPTPTPLRPVEPKRQSPIPPVPPIVQREPRRPNRQPPAMPRTPWTAPTPVPPPMPYGDRSLDTEPAPTTPAGRISLPELETTQIEEFRTVSSTVNADASIITPLSVEDAKARAAVAEQKKADRELWRVALRSPDALRSAFILKEVLGAPRGLQSSAGTPSFPLL